MVRFALSAVAAVVLSVVLQADPASAKLCQPDLKFAPYPPVAGQETTLELSIHSLDDDHEFDDPLCAIEAPQSGEAALRLYMVPPGMPNVFASTDFRHQRPTPLPQAENGHISYEYVYPEAPFVDLEMVNPWRLRASTIFPRDGRWEFSLERLQPDYTPIWRSSVDVLSTAALPSTGSASAGAGTQAALLTYALAAVGGVALLLGGLIRLGGRRF